MGPIFNSSRWLGSGKLPGPGYDLRWLTLADRLLECWSKVAAFRHLLAHWRQPATDQTMVSLGFWTCCLAWMASWQQREFVFWTSFDTMQTPEPTCIYGNTGTYKKTPEGSIQHQSATVCLLQSFSKPPMPISFYVLPSTTWMTRLSVLLNNAL
jgi:hypothetical protein